MRVEEYGYGRDRRMFIHNEDMGVYGASENVPIDEQYNSLHYGSRPLRVAFRIAKDIMFQVVGAADSHFADTADVRLGRIDNSRLNESVSILFERNQPEEIIVEPQTVTEMLEQIRTMQSSRAKELLHKQRIREGDQMPDQIVGAELSAKILTFKR